LVGLKSIKDLLAQHSINKIKIGGFDLDGVLRSKYIHREKFDASIESGLEFCEVIFGCDCTDALYENTRATGWHTGYPDLLAKADLSTFRVIPWEPATAFFILDFYEESGKPLPISPRQVLQRVVSKAQSMGYEPMVSAEFEFFLLKDDPDAIREIQLGGIGRLSARTPGPSALRSGTVSDISPST
jgi:glutamine synthetase